MDPRSLPAITGAEDDVRITPPRMTCESRRRRRLALEERDEAGRAIAQLPPVDDHVDRALLEEELRALEAFGQRLAHRLLDDARAGESDERAGLGDDDIADEREARGDSAHR